MAVLKSFCLDMEIYSVDEAFLRLETRAPASVKNYYENQHIKRQAKCNHLYYIFVVPKNEIVRRGI